MDKEQIVFLAGVTLCALSIGAFILWGPNPRPRKRGTMIGLQNLGLTCFFNTLLQALASCAIFVEWMESCEHQGTVATALYNILKVLSIERERLPPGVEDPLNPMDLIASLHQHGWSIGHGEQDAHELFHLIMVTLEEEAHKAVTTDGGLIDVLDPNTVQKKSLTSTEHERENPCDVKYVDSIPILNPPSGDSASQAQSVPVHLRLINKQGELITRKFVPKYDCNRNYQPSPFCGLLTSQLQCVKCGFKSILRYDKFDSLSLHLPDTIRASHSLCQLLERYTHTEAVTGVACDGCNKDQDLSEPPVMSTALKTVTIGKLPKCLCIHIHRISIGSSNTPYKRSDYVDFPEFLIMDPYTHNSMIKEQKAKEENILVGEEIKIHSLDILPCRTGSCNHMYRLKAVVVHCGSVDSGHFVTYRRGPLQSNIRHRCDRWYFTSDETVRDATLAEAMQAAAYMLFYERCTITPT